MEGGRQREVEKQSISDNRENEDLAKVCTKLAAKHLHALLSYVWTDLEGLWPFSGQRQGGACSWSHLFGSE